MSCCAPPGSTAGVVVVVRGSSATTLLLRLAIRRPDRRSRRTALFRSLLVLARPSRLHRPAEFRLATRSGRRVSAPGLVLHAHATPPDAGTPESAPKVGFVVGKVVGPAVTRNQVRRRLQHLVAARLGELPMGAQLIVRATPASAGRSSVALGESLDVALAKAYRA